MTPDAVEAIEKELESVIVRSLPMPVSRGKAKLGVQIIVSMSIVIPKLARWVLAREAATRRATFQEAEVAIQHWVATHGTLAGSGEAIEALRAQAEGGRT